MTSTRLFVTLMLILAAARSGAAQDAPLPAFRSSVDVLEVDVNVVDSSGRPLADLRAADFTVTVDGQPRTVATSQFVRDDSSDAATMNYKVDPYVASNTDHPRGRLILIVIDQNNISSGRAREVSSAVRAFLDHLPSIDRVALVAIPSPGPAVDFTADHRLINEALLGIRGVDDGNLERYDVGDAEAIAMMNHGDEMMIRRLVERECGSMTDQTCISDLELESSRIVQRIRTRANESFYALSALLNNLREAEGTKSMIFVSQGFIFDDVQAKASALAAVAAEARVNLNVMMLSETTGDAASTRRSASAREDRELREQGLETLAARSRGALFPVAASTEIAFDRLILELSGHYLLGVEPTQKDRDGKTHQIRVQVKRKGASIRARREFRYTARESDRRPREDQLTSLLRSPSTSTELPVRLSAYVFQDPESIKEKVLVAVEIDPLSGGPADLMLGFVLFDAQGRVVTSGRERKIFTQADSHTVQYDAALTVVPGVYRLRFGAIDAAGNRGSLEHEVRVWQMATDGVAAGDLMLGRVPDGASRALRPQVTTRIDGPALVAYTEFYSNRAEALKDVTVTMEVAADESGPAVLREEGMIAPRVEGAGRQASAIIPIAELAPGKYFVRAIVTAGGQVVGKMARPFMVESRQ